MLRSANIRAQSVRSSLVCRRELPCRLEPVDAEVRLRPEPHDSGLLGSALGALDAAERLRFVVVARVLRARERRRRSRAELRRVVEAPRSNARVLCRDRRRRGNPHARGRHRPIGVGQHRIVVCARCQRCRGRFGTQRFACSFRGAFGHCAGDLGMRLVDRAPFVRGTSQAAHCGRRSRPPLRRTPTAASRRGARSADSVPRRRSPRPPSQRA